MNRLTGQHFDVMLGDLLVNVEEATLDIEDSSGENQTNGVPDGWLLGAVKAGGELKLTSREFKKVTEIARSAGSFREIPPFDLGFSADSGDEQQSIEAFGCKLVITSLLGIKGEGGEKNIHTLPYRVTNKQFVKVDGVPYLENERIKNLA